MTQGDKTEQKPAADTEGVRSKDSSVIGRESVKNELSDEALQDVAGGCADGKHMPTA